LESDVRPLKESDIPAIIEISKTTWGGHDHLPQIIGEWLDNSLCHPYVLCIAKEVIGVANVRLIDEGKTAWLEGLRIHEKVRQKGLAQRLTDHLSDVSQQLRVERIRLVASGDNVAPMKLAESIGLEQIINYKVFWKGPTAGVDWVFDKIKLNQIGLQDVKKSLRQFSGLLQEETNPYSKSIIYIWDVYEVSDANLQEIEKHAAFQFGSNGDDAVLTIGGEHLSSDGPEWCFTVYATSEDAFLSGISKNLALAQERSINHVMCVHQPEFEHLYNTVEWLKERNHGISLVLHEMYLKSEMN